MIIAIVGPTGSGKTGLACELSDYLNGAPIISCDAFQIYKDMNIGSAKLDESSPYFGRHYLLNIKSPDEDYSVMEYQNDFRRTLDELLKKHKDVIICGGTGLYLRAGLYDYEFLEENVDTSDLEQYSNDELYDMLLKIDPETTKIIHKNNRKRVIRALAIARNNSMKKSEMIANQKHEMIYEGVKVFFLNPPRDILYERINQSVDVMMEKGLLKETEQLLKNYKLSRTALQAIGYKEMISYLNGELKLEEAIELIKKRSRNYAKRQVTFFKHQFNCIEIKDLRDIINEINK
jgi:tRNA dimethylallyltransferase